MSSGTTYATVICSTPSLAANTTISITVGATLAAVIVANSSLGQDYHDLWQMPFGMTFADKTISMSLTYWIDDGLMALFFLMESNNCDNDSIA